ncbi:hypothetical protein I317_02397 [Kwoniella heveanensis CBS 569]|nr:hypothetical protein I317_02397 [Kwoniella heveanensis CBS 569]
MSAADATDVEYGLNDELRAGSIIRSDEPVAVRSVSKTFSALQYISIQGVHLQYDEVISLLFHLNLDQIKIKYILYHVSEMSSICQPSVTIIVVGLLSAFGHGHCKGHGNQRHRTDASF